MYIAYKLNISEEFNRVIKETARFVGKVRIKLKFEFKICSTIHKQHELLNVKIWYIFICLLYLTN
jgi:hypothetical protein